MPKPTHTYTPALSTQNPTDAEHLERALKTINDSITFAFTLQSQIAAIALSERMGLDSASDLEAAIGTAKAGGDHE